MLQKGVHRHDEEAGECPDDHQQRDRQPQSVHEVHDQHDDSHGDAQRDDAYRLAHGDHPGGGDRPGGDADGDHTLQHARFGKIEL